jgi:hypothetical protein
MSDKKEEILKILKESGLEVAEEVAVETVNNLCEALVKISGLYSNGASGVVQYLVDTFKPKVLAAMDKIDGQDNPAY